MSKPMDYKETADFLGVAESTVRKWVSEKVNGIPVHKIGSGKRSPVRFFQEELEAWVKSQHGEDVKPVSAKEPRKKTERKTKKTATKKEIKS